MPPVEAAAVRGCEGPANASARAFTICACDLHYQSMSHQLHFRVQHVVAQLTENASTIDLPLVVEVLAPAQLW